jgi:hypothetical protein
MNTPSQRFEGGATPLCRQSSYPGACHPSTRLNATRSAGVRKRERGRLDTIAASGGRKEAERTRRIGARRQRERNMDPSTGFPPPLYTCTTSGRHLARCLVSAPPACIAQLLTRGLGACQSDCVGQTSPIRQEGEAFCGRRV